MPNDRVHEAKMVFGKLRDKKGDIFVDDFFDYISEMMDMFGRLEDKLPDIKNGIIGLENS